MSTEGTKPDIAIDEVHTNLEIVESGTLGSGELRRLVYTLVRECLREDRERTASRDQDTRITDRAWRPDLNRE
jgi:hypothetical protein